MFLLFHSIKTIVKGRLHYLFLLLIIGMASIIAVLFLYGGQPTVPRGITISSWEIQGLSYEQLIQQFDTRIDGLKRQQVTLESTRHLDGSANVGQTSIPSATFTLQQLGLSSNQDAIIQDIRVLFDGPVLKRAKQRWQMRNKSFKLQVTFDEVVLGRIILHQWGELHKKQPVDAVRSITADDLVAYTEGEDAYRIQLPQLQLRLQQLFPTLWWTFVWPHPAYPVELPIQVIEPKVTVEQLKKEGIERKVAQFTTTYRASGSSAGAGTTSADTSAGRAHNIESTARVIHDLLLKPGEVFDYGKVIQQTKAKFGFKEAPVILNGNLVPGIGGGICQVSSTLYNAVLRSGLDIVERRNHSLPVQYVPLGQDATFAEGYINFKFRNHDDSHLLIRTIANHGTLTVKLFGAFPSDISYEIRSEAIQTLEPPTQYVKNPSLARGQQKSIRAGRVGYIVKTYRYKKQQGIIVEKKLMSTDTYKPQPNIIATNRDGNIGQGGQRRGGGQPAPKAPTAKRPIVEDGISGPVF